MVACKHSMRKQRLFFLSAAFSVLLLTSAHAETVVSVEGPVGPGLGFAIGGIQDLAVHWSETTSFSNVNITADVACSQKCGASMTVNAWLMTAIGPGSSALEQIAASTASISPVLSFVDLFSGLTLGPGDYYLVLASTDPSAFWAGTSDINGTVTTGLGVLREDKIIVANNIINGASLDPAFPPGSTFIELPTTPDSGGSNDVEFAVTGQTAVSVPEPSSLLLTAVGFFGAIILRKRL